VNTVRWGIVGIGRIVKTTMAPGMLAEPECEIVAGVSRDRARADAFAAEFGARYAYTDYDEMLANPEVDAVFIATPNALHADQVVAAATAGKHVLCDKPLATNVDDALRAVRACADAGVKLGINFHNRRLPWVIDAKAIIADGTIGDVMNIQIEASAGLHPPQDWRADAALSGLGTVYSQGVHVFDLLRFILDSDPAEVVAIFDDEGGTYEVETQALILIRFENGVRVYLNINQSVRYPQNDVAIYGTEGRIVGTGLTRSRFDGEMRVLDAQGESSAAYPQPSGLAHRRNVAAYAHAVLTDQEPNASGIDGLHSMVLCDAIKRSVAERRLVDVDYSPLASVS
jgi:1,5-anhydro-D-fructose reductase (1,5-anhydro-D-mannitol-forming)